PAPRQRSRPGARRPRARGAAALRASLRGEARIRARTARQRSAASGPIRGLRRAALGRGRRAVARGHLPIGRGPGFLRGRLSARLGAGDAPARNPARALGPAWFDEPEAGAFLRELWREGQRLDATELLAELISP